MQIVIELDDEMYKQIIDINGIATMLIPYSDIIRNGTPLPKGHGRIADMDEAIKCIEDVKGEDAIWAINLIEWACSKRIIIEASSKED